MELGDDRQPRVQRRVANLAYFAGRFLQLRGNTDLAKSYYERVLQTHRVNKWNYTLSAVRMREL